MSNVNTKEIENKVSAWLSENDPAAFRYAVQNQARTSAPLLAASPEHSTNIAASAAVVLGKCDYKDTDSAIKKAINANNPNEARRIFRESPLQGCTTVLDMARISSDYDPNIDMNGANQDNYRRYLSKVLNCPLFHLKLNTRDEYNRHESSWRDAINEIADMFTGVVEEDKDKIKQSITNLTNAVTSHRNTKQGTSIFSVSALNTAGDNTEAYIYYSDISMCEDKSKGSDCKQTSLNIYKTYLAFRRDLWPIYADQIFDKHYKAVSDWINDNSTPQGEVKSNLCIGGYKKI